MLGGQPRFQLSCLLACNACLFTGHFSPCLSFEMSEMMPCSDPVLLCVSKLYASRTQIKRPHAFSKRLHLEPSKVRGISDSGIGILDYHLLIQIQVEPDSPAGLAWLWHPMKPREQLHTKDGRRSNGPGQPCRRCRHCRCSSETKQSRPSAPKLRTWQDHGYGVPDGGPDIASTCSKTRPVRDDNCPRHA